MKKSELNIDNLKNAIASLQESWVEYNASNQEKIKIMFADSCVKRFEYTLEISWKTMKKYLKKEYSISDKELTINNIFRYMAGYDLITNWESWRLYYTKRNDTAHEYNREKAHDLLTIIPQFITDMHFFINALDNALEP